MAYHRISAKPYVVDHSREFLNAVVIDTLHVNRQILP